MPYDRNLDPTTRGYCDQICKNHENQKKRCVTLHRKGYKDTNRTELYDLPAAAVTCSNGRYRVCDYSRGVNEKHVREPLKSAIKALGTIGGHRLDGKCGNVLGRCAEQHAASTLQNQHHSTTDPKNLRFSKALRPRTMEVVDYCKNCKEIFNL